MDFNDTAEEAEFRAQARAFLEQHCDPRDPIRVKISSPHCSSVDGNREAEQQTKDTGEPYFDLSDGQRSLKQRILLGGSRRPSVNHQLERDAVSSLQSSSHCQARYRTARSNSCHRSTACRL